MFDTHEAAKELERAGFSDEQVEALVSVARRTTVLPDISALATKADIAELRAEFRAENATTKLQVITVLLPGVAAIMAIVSAASRLIH